MVKSLCYSLSLIFNILFFLQANAATIQAVSCNSSDVQSAINKAVDGDTVLVPIGTCTWTSAVFLSNKSINLLGSGMDQTIIMDKTGQAGLNTFGDKGKTYRISSFTFDAAGSGKWGTVAIDGGCENFRVDHCKFQNLTKRGLTIFKSSYGVVDHCVFVLSANLSVQAVSVFGDGDAAWSRPFTPGSEKAVYVEDCTFDFAYRGDSLLDAYGGARYVFRYNTVKGSQVGHHGFDSGGYRSTHTFEIYNNTFTTTSDVWVIFNARGGTGVLFNNVATGSYKGGFVLTYYRSCLDQSYPRCDGNNPLDGNADSSGYPCKDQHGRTTDHDNDGIQDLVPIYEWNNTLNGSNVNIGLHDPWGCTNPSMSDHIKEGREFYNDTIKPNYTPYTYPHPLIAAGVSTPQNLRFTDK